MYNTLIDRSRKQKEDDNLKRKRQANFVLLFIGVCMIAYGAFRGEVDTVLAKAVKICMECVGIG